MFFFPLFFPIFLRHTEYRTEYVSPSDNIQAARSGDPIQSHWPSTYNPGLRGRR